MFDAEHSYFQPAIHNIVLDLQRTYNKGEKARVYNTFQMYLKSSERELERSILLSGIAWTVVVCRCCCCATIVHFETNRFLFVLVFLWCSCSCSFVYYRERRMAFCYKISTWCVYDIRKAKSR